jgi:hypothetical protein
MCTIAATLLSMLAPSSSTIRVSPSSSWTWLASMSRRSRVTSPSRASSLLAMAAMLRLTCPFRSSATTPGPYVPGRRYGVISSYASGASRAVAAR